MTIIRESVRSKVELLGRAFLASWSLDTSSLWEPESPARGQCSVTALVAQNVLGGDILKTDVGGRWHFYNRIDGHIVDFTAAQFDVLPTYLDLPATADEALADTSRKQFETLRASVSQALATKAAERIQRRNLPDIAWELRRSRELVDILEKAARSGDLGMEIDTTQLNVEQTVERIWLQLNQAKTKGPVNNIRHAEARDLHVVMDLIRSCVHHMVVQGIHQWDEIYPDEATFAKDIERQELFVLEKEGRIRGAVTLNDFQAPAYQEVKWQFTGKALVIHRLAIDPSSQGKGYAMELMQFAYEFAKKRRYTTIRLDAFVYNPRAVTLYERLGYQKAGTVIFRKGPFFCFEIQVA